MKKTIKTVHSIDAPVHKVWDYIQRGDGVEVWLPIVGSSRLEGTNRRFCTLQDGAPLEETILKSDDLHIFMYSIDRQASFPVNRPMGTMRLESSGEGTTLFWDLEFELIDEEAEAAFSAQVEEIYASAAQKLELLAKGQVAA
ncbi:MAG: SRPBCC family protein [Bacteroidota bacterium]